MLRGGAQSQPGQRCGVLSRPRLGAEPQSPQQRDDRHGRRPGRLLQQPRRRLKLSLRRRLGPFHPQHFGRAPTGYTADSIAFQASARGRTAKWFKGWTIRQAGSRKRPEGIRGTNETYRTDISPFDAGPGMGMWPAAPTLAGGKPVSYWLRTLHDADPKERKEAADKLGNAGSADPAVCPALVEALQTPCTGAAARRSSAWCGAVRRRRPPCLPCRSLGARPRPRRPGLRRPGAGTNPGAAHTGLMFQISRA